MSESGPNYLTSCSSSLLSSPWKLSIRSPSSSTLSSSSDFKDHCHGHKYNAIIVSVVSRQLDNVRVEQNHCQGLTTVNASYEDQISQCTCRQNVITHSSPRFNTAWSIYPSCKLPGIIVSDCRKATLRHLRRRDQEVRSIQWRESQDVRDHVRDMVHACKDRRVDGRT